MSRSRLFQATKSSRWKLVAFVTAASADADPAAPPRASVAGFAPGASPDGEQAGTSNASAQAMTPLFTLLLAMIGLMLKFMQERVSLCGFADEPVAEIVQCGEPFLKRLKFNDLPSKTNSHLRTLSRVFGSSAAFTYVTSYGPMP
jgi:hypothetical protein